MNRQYRPTTAVISSSALLHNLAVARKYAGNAQVIAVIKADAYGHGLVEVARILQDSSNEFAVVSLDDAIRLRQAGIVKPITLLSGFYSREEAADLLQWQVTPVIYDPVQMDYLQSLELDQTLSVWLKIDTGMGRMGVLPEFVQPIYAQLKQHKNIVLRGVLSHFASADQPDDPKNQQQLDCFLTLSEHFQGECLSMANSAALVSQEQALFDFVRPGIMLYGSSPLAGVSAEDLGLQPAMALKSALIAVKKLKKGQTIGYSATWSCPYDMKVGIVACGYGDGYPRHAPSGTPVIVNGQRTVLLGRVSMDTLCVDLNTCDAKVGDEVELWGNDLSVDEVAGFADTIAYELLSGVTIRVPRIY